MANSEVKSSRKRPAATLALVKGARDKLVFQGHLKKSSTSRYQKLLNSMAAWLFETFGSSICALLPEKVAGYVRRFGAERD